MIGGLAVVVAAMVTVTLWPTKKSVTEEEAQPSAAVTKKPARVVPKVEKPARPSETATRAQQRPRGAQAAGQGKSVTEPGAVAADAEAAENARREKAVAAWDSFIDEVAERAEPPTAEQAAQFKEAFHKLDKEDQMAGIQNALNLIPDEHFPIFYPILYDKTEDADVLDEIFSDGLNHDDEIKVPMMKELYKDKEHPMFVEAARILDATGELDEMKGQGEPAAEEEE